MIKNTYSTQWKIPGQLCLSGQAQVAQKSWIIKNTYSVAYSKFRAHSVFQGKRKLLKNPECKNVFNTVKNSRATLFFRASASRSKTLNDKIYFNTVKNSIEDSVFQGKRSCSKILNSKKYIQYSEKFQGKLCFQGKRKLLKILNIKSIFTTVKIFRATLFFSGQAQVAQKSWTVKTFSTQCRFFFKENVRYPIWTCRDPISLIL